MRGHTLKILSPHVKRLCRPRVLMVLLGLFLLVNGLWIPAKAQVAQVLLSRAWSASVQQRQNVKPWPWADMVPVGKLSYEGKDTLILAGASGQSMAFGPGHVSHSAPLTSNGNAVVAAHRDTHFSFLKDVRVGDEMSVSTTTNRKTYRVFEMGVTDMADTRVMADEAKGVLTLVTCFPFDAVVPGGRQRYVVRLEEVESSPSFAWAMRRPSVR